MAIAAQSWGDKLRLTLVSLLLDLDLLGEVLAALPLDFMTDSSVIDKVTSVPDLLLRTSAVRLINTCREAWTDLVVVGLCELRVLKEVVGGKVEVKLESWLVLV